MEAEHYSDLLGCIYDAAINPELWPSVLEKLCSFVGGSEANFTLHDTSRSVTLFFSWGDDPHYTKLYQEKYASINPLHPSALLFPVGEVFALENIMSHEELEQTPFYKDYLVPRQWLDFVACNVEKSATSVASVAIVRHTKDGRVNQEVRSRAQLVAPHLGRAVAVGKLIGLAKVDAAQFADTLDELAAGMFLVDSSAQIIHANASGCAILAGGEVMCAIAGRMVARDRQANQTLRETLSAVAEGDVALGGRSVALPLPGRDGDHVAHVLPLTSAARRQASAAYRAVAAIFVTKATMNLQSPLDAVSRRYNLTAGEMRVLVALLNGGSVADVARTLGLTTGTVRNHLHHLFEKTGTARQTDLVRLVVGFAGAVVN